MKRTRLHLGFCFVLLLYQVPILTLFMHHNVSLPFLHFISRRRCVFNYLSKVHKTTKLGLSFFFSSIVVSCSKAFNISFFRPAKESRC
ncbi:Uncharacterized protein APZ42_023729 [Daphnia magna]|uniref:Uncharacterized protein n=1 Tax=Daphnia magna TaxID=35525 RepID=A0A164UPX8_9CRUS|nr:Uncharacterized protein APZ42_023729 [Daphnia magna]